MPDRSRCPNCREPVSPFAAGCAICGTDLDAKRWDTGPSLLTRIGSWFSALALPPVDEAVAVFEAFAEGERLAA